MNLRAWLTLQHAALRPADKALRIASHRDAPDIAGLSVEQSHIDHDLNWQQQSPLHHIVPLGHQDYPKSLRALGVPPIVLYVVGDPEILNLPALAMVGSRNASHEGLATAREFAADVASKGLVIASGLAQGIDTSAHRGALDAKGYTVAYMGTGADRIYPAMNQKLAHEIAENGALVSCFALGSPPAKHNFPIRNRLIAVNSTATLVVEASLNSGSLITARLAADHGRDVMAIPGSRHSPVSAGCHKLIRSGATLVTNTRQVLEELALNLSEHPALCPTDSSDEPAPTETPSGLDAQHLSILEAMGFGPLSIDELAGITEFKAEQIAASMLMLSLHDQVEALGNGRYVRLKN